MKTYDGTNDAPVRSAEFSICRPGHGASCALCCGSHNFNCTREDLLGLMEHRASRLSLFSPEYLLGKVRQSRSNLTGSIYFSPVNFFLDEPPPLDESSPRCPFLAIDETGTTGCALNREAHRHGGTVDCVLSYRGKRFMCPAGERLSTREIRFAAQFAGDWYFYSILIHNNALLSRMLREWGDPGAISAVDREPIEEELERYRVSCLDIHRIDNYYGVPR